MDGFSRHKITHLSPSSLNLWINCPALWVAEKIFGHRGPASASMARGIAVEDAVVAVLAHGKSEEDAVTSALRNFDARFFIGTEKTTAERNLVAPMVSQAIAALAPLGEPEFPEKGAQNKIELVCNCGGFKIPMIGYLDLFYPQHGRVIDLKTTQRMPSRMSPEHQLQRVIYARAKRNHSVEFLYVTPSKSAILADGDVSAVLERVKAHVIRLEAFLRLLDREQMRAVVPLCDTSFYMQGSTALSEIYGLSSP
jgi:hypothetical protein